MNTLPLRPWFVSLPLCLVAFPALAANPAVRVWQTNEVIPTYLAAPPSPIPRFYSGRTYQGAKATFYPYPVQDQLTDIKTNKTYNMVYLENDYIKIGVLPEIGGRIFSAVDKSNGYNFFYRQHVIKPALIGMLGAWISGGVEWNIPHHHRASSFMPVEYTTVTNADGSATIWVGETELRHRMRWLVGMTLYPDRSYLELNCKVFNRTPFAHPMLFWINPAVHANTNYQVIFPPSTEWAVQHAKPEFASWPVARQVYGGVDYTRGVDISWWKNHPSPVSFFAWNYEDDWFGGYDHGKQAGVLHVADHNVAPGKKFFEWGNGPEGEMWSKVLTDDDGPYLELMAGAWSDNQPDYSWIQPGETREWQHWWYPIRDLGGVKAANKDVALNLEIIGDNARITVNSTRLLPRTLIRLLGREPEETAATPFWKTNLSMTPGQTWSAEIPLKKYFMNPTNIGMEVLEAEYYDHRRHPQRLLVSYHETARKNTPMPKPVERPRNPKDYASVDELYFTGQRIEQLCSPSFEAAPYYQEILRRDPGDYRANTAMGIFLCKQWRWEEAEKHLRAAITRATANHIRPRDGEAFYYLGVSLRNQNVITNFPLSPPQVKQYEAGLERAEEVFRKAAWSEAWKAPSYLQLAELSGQRGDFAGGISWLDAHLALNGRNAYALSLKAGYLNWLDKHDAAAKCAAEAQLLDPLDPHAELEAHLAANQIQGVAMCAPVEMKKIRAIFSESSANSSELVASYMRAGLDSGALARCLVFETNRGGTAFQDIALNYQAADYVNDFLWQDYDFIKATATRLTGAFPFQPEFIPVFMLRAGRSPADPMPLYALGNLLYDNQPERAIPVWETALERMKIFAPSDTTGKQQLHALILRNLGLGYAQHQKDLTKAITSLEQAVLINPKEPRFLYELDVQHEAGGAAVRRRLEWLTKAPGVAAQRDDSLTRLILVYLADGQLDKALKILTSHRFHNWEGSSEIRNVYVDARLMRGQQHLRAKRGAEALKNFEAAQEFPANLEVGRPKRDAQVARIAYHLGLAQEALGNAEKAKEHFTQASAGRGGGASESSYYRALALQKVSRADDAKPIFENLVKQGQELQASEPADYFAKFGEKRAERVRKADAHYLSGLGYLGLGKKAEAEAEFKQALELHPAHLGTLSALAR